MNEVCAELQGKIVLRKMLTADEERVAFLAGRGEPQRHISLPAAFCVFGLVAVSLKS
jgi:hypothetical protein